jgi:probable phosphoglycerate mutase
MGPRGYGDAVSQAIPQPTLLVQSDFATELLLIRHGRSDAVVPGSPESEDPPLADVGVEQARALAARLQPKQLDAVYASDLRRAIDTARPLAEPRNLELSTTSELREVHLGDWEHGEYRRRAAALDPEWVAHARAGRWDLVPGSEGDAALRARVTRVIDGILAAHDGGSVAVVCHGGVINAYLAALWGMERSFAIAVENTSVTIVRAGPERKMVITANDASHLYDAALGPPVPTG